MAFLKAFRLGSAWWARLAAGVLLAGAPAWANSRSDAEPPTELKVTAAFLLNFAGFVEWPTTAFATPADPIVIGIYGSDPFRDFIDRLLENEMVCGRPLNVRRFPSGSNPVGCHILFISESEARTLGGVLGRTARQPILTVSSVAGFTRQGGMIQLIRERGRIRFQINQTAAQSAGLTLSSRLLRLGRNPGN